MHGQEILLLNLALLERLQQAVLQSPPTMDHDLSHWKIGHMYFGQAIWGDVTLRTSWMNIQLTGYR
jgi:hypothetical protein